jgi:hypothetical protein
VPDAHYKGFSMHESAAQHYFDAKKAHKVKVVRNPGDKENMGQSGAQLSNVDLWKLWWSRVVNLNHFRVIVFFFLLPYSNMFI